MNRQKKCGISVQWNIIWASLVAQLVKNPLAMQETWVQSPSWEDPWRRERLPSPVFWPGEFHGPYSPWGHKESDMTERLSKCLFFTFLQMLTIVIIYLFAVFMQI